MDSGFRRNDIYIQCIVSTPSFRRKPESRNIPELIEKILFSHEEDDIESFRFIISQLVVSGNVKQIEISRAFGIAYINVKRSVKILRDEGPKVFLDFPRINCPMESVFVFYSIGVEPGTLWVFNRGPA